MKIYVLKDGLRYGPYSVGELRQALATGIFKREHFASVDDCASWKPISGLRGITPPPFSVETDRARNLLTISYHGRVGRNDVEQCAEEIRQALSGLDRDFQLLADFTKLEEMDVSCARGVAEIMERCNTGGVSIVVRVIPEPKQDIGLQIMSLFHYGNNVCIRTCTSRSQAFKILSGDDDVMTSADRKTAAGKVS